MGVWVLGQLMKIPNLEVVFFFSVFLNGGRHSGM